MGEFRLDQRLLIAWCLFPTNPSAAGTIFVPRDYSAGMSYGR
jgi:hypothetical protein